MKKKFGENAFAYCITFALGYLMSSMFIKCKDTKVYMDYKTCIYHNTPVCDSINGFDKDFYEEYGDIVGSEEVSKKKVFYNKKYKMCNYCFSKFDIQSRNKYIN